jgi:hypothetical protein
MLFRSLLLAAVAVGAASVAMADPIDLTDTLGSGTATVVSPVPGQVLNPDGSPVSAGGYQAGTFSLATDPQGAAGVQLFSYQSAAGMGDQSPNNVDFLNPAGTGVEAQLQYLSYNAGYEVMSLTDFADDPGALPGLTAGATDVAYGLGYSDPTYGLAVNMDEPADTPPTDVPEPASLAVMCVGLVSVAVLRRRRATARAS